MLLPRASLGGHLPRGLAISRRAAALSEAFSPLSAFFEQRVYIQGRFAYMCPDAEYHLSTGYPQRVEADLH
jgi:hypothetical protein